MGREPRPPVRRAAHGVWVHGVHDGSIGRDRRFRQLRVRFAWFAAVLILTFLGWYFLYVLMSVFAREFMARPVVGNINVALVFGVLQFASTFALAWGYATYARHALDPLSRQLRGEDQGLTARRTPPTRLGGYR